MTHDVINGSIFGVYRALVVDAADPKKQARVKVHVPDLMLDKGWCGEWCTNGIWAHSANNWIGGRNIYDTDGTRCSWTDAIYQGSCMPPAKGSHVFLFFEKGDPSRPYYFGAADYGQTKTLPENRYGSSWWKKWTPIKTHDGRTLIFSDDVDDARVELTGKKRQLKRPPDGDTESVFNIDGNQTTFLIDERPGHEKVFLKDYRGNYFKMIQDEDGEQDKLYIHMGNDIHITTPKNIFITAGEDIHITAKKNIFVTALNDMHIKVTNHLTEMANLIDRFSKTNDNRYAAQNINDKAELNINVGAGITILNKAGANCFRSAGANISDVANVAVSIQSAAVTSVVGGGGVFVDGPVVTVNNGSAPIPVVGAVETAAPSPQATPALESPSRKFTPVDDGWEPTVSDPNLQDRPHASYWKPQWTWSSLTQDWNAKVNAPSGGSPEAFMRAESTPNPPNPPSPESKQEVDNKVQSAPKKPVSVAKEINDAIEETDNLAICEDCAHEVIDTGVDNLAKNIKGDISDAVDVSTTATPIIKEKLSKNVSNRMSLMEAELGNRAAKQIAKTVVADAKVQEKLGDELKESAQDMSKSIGSRMAEMMENGGNVTRKRSTKRSGYNVEDVAQYIRSSMQTSGIQSFVESSLTTMNNFVGNSSEAICSNFGQQIQNFDQIYQDSFDIIQPDYVAGIGADIDSAISAGINELQQLSTLPIDISTINQSLPEITTIQQASFVTDYYNSCMSTFDISNANIQAGMNQCMDMVSSGIGACLETADVATKMGTEFVSMGIDTTDNCLRLATDAIAYCGQNVDAICDYVADNVLNTLNDFVDYGVGLTQDAVSATVSVAVGPMQSAVSSVCGIANNVAGGVDSLMQNTVGKAMNAASTGLVSNLHQTANNIAADAVTTLQNVALEKVIEETYSNPLTAGIADSVLGSVPNVDNVMSQFNPSIVDSVVSTFEQHVPSVEDVVCGCLDEMDRQLHSSDIVSQIENYLHDVDTDVANITYDYILSMAPNLNVRSHIVDMVSRMLLEPMTSLMDSVVADTVSSTVSVPPSMEESANSYDMYNTPEYNDYVEECSDVFGGTVAKAMQDIQSLCAGQINESTPECTRIDQSMMEEFIESLPQTMFQMQEPMTQQIFYIIEQNPTMFNEETPSEQIAAAISDAINNVLNTTSDIIVSASEVAEQVSYEIEDAIYALFDAAMATEADIINSINGILDKYIIPDINSVMDEVTDVVHTALDVAVVKPLDVVNDVVNTVTSYVVSGVDYVTDKVSDVVDGIFDITSDVIAMPFDVLDKVTSAVAPYISPQNVTNYITPTLNNVINNYVVPLNPLNIVDKVVDKTFSALKGTIFNALSAAGDPTCVYDTKRKFYGAVNNVVDAISYVDNAVVNAAHVTQLLASNAVNDLIDGGMSLLNGALSSGAGSIMCNAIVRSVAANCAGDFSTLSNLIQVGTDNWTVNDIGVINDCCGRINACIQNAFTPQYIISTITSPAVRDEISALLYDKMDVYPTPEKIRTMLCDGQSMVAQSAVNTLKNAISENIILTENIPNNTFIKDKDLTKIYSIPGVVAQTCKCNCDDDSDEALWCDPDIIGGCGCSYEYMLYLQDRYFRTLIPMMFNDGIKTFGISVNPDMDKYTDNEFCLHDLELIESHKQLVQEILNGNAVSNSKYLDRIDEIMTMAEALDCTVIVNLMDFHKNNYEWMKDVPETIRYTDDMWSYNNFYKYLETVIKKIYMKDESDGSERRRRVRIVLNLGTGRYINTTDVNDEKYTMYPNCGYLRSLIMHLAYQCKVSSNYMSIPANENSNLYYYSPYAEFKSYNDVERITDEHEIIIRDIVDGKSNGLADIVTYDKEDSSIQGGYLNYYKKCNPKSYVLSYIYDLNVWLNKMYDNNQTIKEHYTLEDGTLDTNVMNDIFTPNARTAMRYMYLGHDKYFEFENLKFDPVEGEVL